MANAERPARREALLAACGLLNQTGRSWQVLELLSTGIEKPIPAGDIAGIVPGAYGPLMRAAFDVARQARR
jgi:hypothetical protein